ncbi:MAG: hypothetical protein FJ144_09320 [Deltaproteobacteria bacterium]|nr:hypothetical protein [Deltaproteobacteria bacterium]
MSPPTDAPLPAGEDALLSFAPIGPGAFLVETNPAELEGRLRRLAVTAGPREISTAFSNQRVPPPGWRATVSAFGEVLPGDLFGDRGYAWRTNLVDPVSGVTVLAYTRTPPGEPVAPLRDVRVSGRLEGWSRQGAGVLILVDSTFEPQASTVTRIASAPAR